MSNNPVEVRFDTAYTWQLTVKQSAGLNGFWCTHECGDITSPPINIVGAENFPYSTGIQTKSKHNDGWSICFLDAENNLWVATDWMAGSSSGDYNLPDNIGNIEVSVNTQNGDVYFVCTYQEDNETKTKDFTINKTKLYSSLD